MAERHLGPEDLADRMGVTIQTVYYWNKLGTGPRFMKIGRRCRYRLVDVVAWEEARMVSQGSAA